MGRALAQATRPDHPRRCDSTDECEMISRRGEAHEDQSPGRCVFCDGLGLTEEHIWADWLKAYVPRPHTRTKHIVTSNISYNEQETQIIRRSDRNNRLGDPMSRKLRVVCRQCSTGWMRRIKSLAKPSILKAMDGDLSVLQQSDLDAISIWYTKFAMVADYSHPEYVFTCLPSENNSPKKIHHLWEPLSG